MFDYLISLYILTVRFVLVRFGVLQLEFTQDFSRFRTESPFCSVRFGSVRFGSVRFGSVWFGSARFGSVRLGAVRFGAVRCGVYEMEVLVRIDSVWIGLYGSDRFHMRQRSVLPRSVLREPYEEKPRSPYSGPCMRTVLGCGTVRIGTENSV